VDADCRRLPISQTHYAVIIPTKKLEICRDDRSGDWFLQRLVGNQGTPFFDARPGLDSSKFVVHHAVEQQVLNRYPGRFTPEEIHALGDLRGISKDVNAEVPLSSIRKEWNAFYEAYPNATKEDILAQAARIDEMYGSTSPTDGSKSGQSAGLVRRGGFTS
jgi:hypothetical protein